MLTKALVNVTKKESPSGIEKKPVESNMFARMLSKKRSVSFEKQDEDSNPKSKNVLEHLGAKLQHKIESTNEKERQRRSMLVYGTSSMREKKAE